MRAEDIKGDDTGMVMRAWRLNETVFPHGVHWIFALGGAMKFISLHAYIHFFGMYHTTSRKSHKSVAMPKMWRGRANAKSILHKCVCIYNKMCILIEFTEVGEDILISTRLGLS